MKTIRLTYPHTFTKSALPATACAFGFFDGVHKGHQKLIQSAIDTANNHGIKSAVMTFHPHPKDVLQKQSEPMKYITPLNEKEAILSSMGVDYLYVVTFNESLAALAPETFINHFVEQLHITHVIGGFDYSFGHKGKGTMETMKKEANGRYETIIVPKLTNHGEKVSSTAIRKLLSKGNVQEITELLGRSFSVRGTVVTGEKRGRTIGFPTANVKCEQDALLPAIGVYAVTITVQGETYQGMANVGYVPTFHKNLPEARLEVYIFEFKQDIYNEDVRVSFHSYIRDEKAFNGVDELIKQLEDDEKTIKGSF